MKSRTPGVTKDWYRVGGVPVGGNYILNRHDVEVEAATEDAAKRMAKREFARVWGVQARGWTIIEVRKLNNPKQHPPKVLPKPRKQTSHTPVSPDRPVYAWGRNPGIYFSPPVRRR